jgi:hypothetical protein
MKLKITITMDNAAFEAEHGTTGEACRILRELSESLAETTLSTGHIRGRYDINGNRVGEARVTR